MAWIPAGSLTNEELEKEIEKLDELIKKERVAEGLPAEPPDDFVPVALSIVLVRRCKPFRDFLIKFTALLNESNEPQYFDTAKLDKYRYDAELLSKSIGLRGLFWGSIMLSAITEIEKMNKAIEKGTSKEWDVWGTVRNFLLNIEILDCEPPYDDEYAVLEPEERKKIESEVKAEVERLASDDDYLQSELKKYREQYESIKHLI